MAQETKIVRITFDGLLHSVVFQEAYAHQDKQHHFFCAHPFSMVHFLYKP